MRVLICYSSKNGCAEECAGLLKKEICDNFEVDIHNLANGMPELSSYDFVVAGGGIHFGKFYPPMKKFLTEKGQELADIPHGLFLTCAEMELADGYMKELYPKELYESALIREYFGGQLKIDKHKGIWKLIIRMVRNHYLDREDPLPLPDIIESNISLFASKLVIYRKEYGEDMRPDR